jgi:hypothetical protein
VHRLEDEGKRAFVVEVPASIDGPQPLVTTAQVSQLQSERGRNVRRAGTLES